VLFVEFTSEEPDSDGCDGAGEVPALQQAQAAHLTARKLHTWKREPNILDSCIRRWKSKEKKLKAWL